MAERRGGLGARLARRLAGLGVRRERREKRTPEEARARDRPWGGQSCPDLAQGQGSTSSVSLKAQAQSRSDWDLRAGSRGSWFWKRRHSSGGPTQPLGRLQRPAVGSASDLANYASVGPESLALAVASAEPAAARCPSCPVPAPGCLEQGLPGCTCPQPLYIAPEVPLRPEPPGNLEDVLPRPASLPMAEGAKGESATPGPALPEPAQALHKRPSARKTRYHITVTLQGCGQAPGEEGEEPKPAQPAPHPCGPEESRGWQEPPQGPRPITGCLTNRPQELRLRAPRHQGSTDQRQELQAGQTPGSPHRQELDHTEPRTPQDRLPGPNMEEAGGPPARAEARVVSATLTWRQRPPAQEEIRHRFHKVSLVSGAQMEAPREEMFEYSYRREEVNGFAAREEETVNCQGPRDGAGSKSFQSHGPIFSKKYTPPPKEKRPVGRLKEAVDQVDGSSQDPRTEPPNLGAVARTEYLVPLPGPREPSPHPGVSHISGSLRSLEERRVTRTVRTTMVMGGHVDRRANSSVTVGPTLPGEALPRGRNAARTVRAVVVRPRADGSPSRSQALELLSSLVPAERSPPTGQLPRPMAAVPRSPGLGGSEGEALGQLPETGTAVPKDGSALAPAGISEGVHLPQNQDVPAAHPDQDQVKAPDARARESPRVQGASSRTQLPLQTSQGHAPVPSSPRLQTQAPSLGPVHPPEQPVVPTHPEAQLTLKPRGPQALPSVKTEGLTDSPAATILPMVRSEVVTVPGQPLAPSSTRRKAVPSPRGLSAPPSPRNKLAQDSENVPIFSLTQKEVVQGPGIPADPSPTQKEVVQSPSAPAASSPKPTNVVQGPEGSPSTQKEVVQGIEGSLAPSLTKEEAVQGLDPPAITSPQKDKFVQGSEESPVSSPTQKEAVQGIEGSLAPSLTKEEAVQGLAAPAVPSPQKDKLVQSSEESPISCPTQKEVVQGPGASAAPFSTQKVVVQGPAVLPASSSVGKVCPHSPGGPPVPVPMGAEASLESQLVPESTEGKALPEPSREEEEVALATDLEIFLDTLRSMEPPEILHTHRLPRAPRSSYLAMYATLPPIEEDHPGPWVLGSSPQEGPALEEEEEEEEEEDEEEEEEEPENPYLSDDEKLQRMQEKARPGPSWDSRHARPPQASCSPLEMMKKHVAGAKGPHPELGPEWQAGGRPTSRLGGSLLFGGLVPATKEAPTLETLGTKLSALPSHGAPGLRKVPGQLPLLCSERPPPEKPTFARPPEGWSPALKTQGKLNTRPGKMILFSEPSCQGSSREVWEDIADASSWARVASIRVVRGCWVLYEEPEFQGRKLVLPEGDVELGTPGSAWSTQGIGSLRRVVRDYITPQICLYSEEGLKGEEVKLTEALEDPQGLKKPLQVASATVSAGLWLLYPKPFFEDTPYILEPGQYPTSEAWGTSDPSMGSLKPIRLGCPSVEKPGEPKAVVYEAPGFQGQSWEVSRDIYNLQQPEDSQSPQLPSVGSLRVLGGCWVGYEKEGFRGHQYLLEEGEYADWSQWGGYDEALTSLRVIRTDFGDPAVVLFEAMDFEGNSVEVSEALPDVERARHGPHTQAIHVLSGVWVAYEEVGFSGEQYVLEKGVYRNCDDWGAGNSALASLQPVLQVGEHNLHFVSKIQLFSGPNFLGDQISFEDDQTSLPTSFQPQSCRVHGSSWILFDEKNFEGDQHILSEGEFPTLTAMGCQASAVLGSLQKVPLHFSEPSIFLYGLECFEGKEMELSREVRSLQAEGFNNHVLSVRIKGGVWVLCEHSDFRGRQWLVSSCEITNWLTYSGTQRVGSLYPIKQRRAYFRLWNAALGGFLAVPDHVEDMKAGRVVVSEPQAGGSCVWYYEDGLLKNQVAPTMSLQVIGPPSPGSKVVLWAENRLPRQTWSISESGHICSQMFDGRILDVKGGWGYDRDHVVLWELANDRESQIWTVHVL
ncbi:PREDICTED: absent in melanoma 1-like protein [Ceratotherium simum simum]|uniref:Absent in melanoma 1-like protein n=1 Tax=Ceratotherium simum simum TaxID=73337 RepID=A0ABM0HFT9_CERSS|nr:PREDICTED: absent in melanoma 1-like protein [Ceratotherium simum simum]